MDPVKKMFRCTRNDEYQDDSLVSHKEAAWRQGYLIEADSIMEAIDEMRRRFPDDKHGFTAILWKHEPAPQIPSLGRMMEIHEQWEEYEEYLKRKNESTD